MAGITIQCIHGTSRAKEPPIECMCSILDRRGLSIEYIRNWRVRTEIGKHVYEMSAPYLSQPLCACRDWVNRRAVIY